MGYPLPQDIKWICDKCHLIVEFDKAIFPNPNKLECYHKECFTLLQESKKGSQKFGDV